MLCKNLANTHCKMNELIGKIKVPVSIRCLNLLILSLNLLWFLSFFLALRSGKGFVSNLNLFWDLIFFGTPYVTAVLVLVLLLVHLKQRRRITLLSITAFVLTAFPWCLYSAFILRFL
jgi:hypothetical protein